MHYRINKIKSGFYLWLLLQLISSPVFSQRLNPDTATGKIINEGKSAMLDPIISLLKSHPLLNPPKGYNVLSYKSPSFKDDIFPYMIPGSQELLFFLYYVSSDGKLKVNGETGVALRLNANKVDGMLYTNRFTFAPKYGSDSDSFPNVLYYKTGEYKKSTQNGLTVYSDSQSTGKTKIFTSIDKPFLIPASVEMVMQEKLYFLRRDIRKEKSELENGVAATAKYLKSYQSNPDLYQTEIEVSQEFLKYVYDTTKDQGRMYKYLLDKERHYAKSIAYLNSLSDTEKKSQAIVYMDSNSGQYEFGQGPDAIKLYRQNPDFFNSSKPKTLQFLYIKAEFVEGFHQPDEKAVRDAYMLFDYLTPQRLAGFFK